MISTSGRPLAACPYDISQREREESSGHLQDYIFAVKVVNNILSGSQAIVSILHRSGLSLEQIARAAPRIQTAFRAYLDAIDKPAAQVCDDATCDESSRVSLQSILQTTGVPPEEAEKHAMIIQAAFRGHYERMLSNESQGMIQWQRATTRTLEILRKAGASQAEASRAAIIIQATYRGYYTRRNLKMKMKAIEVQEEGKESEVDIIEPDEAVQAVAWLDMMYEESGLTPERANEAVTIIQKAYRQYREKKSDSIPPPVESTKSAVAEANLKNLHQRVFDEVMARAGIPTEFGSQEDSTETGEELECVFKDRLMRARLAEEGYHDDEEEGEELVHVEESNEWFQKLSDNMYSIGMAED